MGGDIDEQNERALESYDLLAEQGPYADLVLCEVCETNMVDAWSPAPDGRFICDDCREED